MDRIIKFFRKGESGQSLVELMIAIGLISLLLPAILSGIMASRGGRAQDDQRVGAVAVLKDAQEAVRSVYLRDWTEIENNGIYHPEISTDKWILASGSGIINGFTVSADIDDVYRDSNGDIVISGGEIDPSTKEVLVTVSWNSPFSSSISSTNYFTRYVNYSHLETTVSDFTPGATSSGTLDIAITDTDGGEFQLSSGGGNGDWCSPDPVQAEYNLPKNGVANAISAIEGEISVGTGENASGVSYASVNVDLDLPPNPQIQETFDGYKTNVVFNENDYAYIGTDTNSKEVVIINLNEYSDPPTNSKYKEEGYFDAPGAGDGDAIAVSGDYGYMADGSDFYIFDLSSKSGSRSQVNSSALGLSGNAEKIIIIGNYAFVATDATTNQLQIINISDPANPTVVGERSVSGGAGKDVAVNETGTRAYLATANSASKDEFFIIDTQDKSAPTLVTGGTFDTNGMDPKGVGVVTGNRAIIVGTGGTDQYQVLNIANENSPTICGTLQVPTGINGLATVLQSNGLAFSYIITGDSSSELKVILGGAGSGGNYNSAGVFESYVFEAATEAAWNKFFATTSVPQNTTLGFRVAVKSGIAGKCSGVVFEDADFVGPDGTTGTLFTSAGGQIPFVSISPNYSNPGRCMKYRAYLETTDITQTPVIYEVNFNYSL